MPTTIIDAVDVSLTFAGTTTYHPMSVTFEHSVNQGIKWTARVLVAEDPEGYALPYVQQLASPLPKTQYWPDPTLSNFTKTWILRVRSRGGVFATWDSPPLVMLDAVRTYGLAGDYMEFSGTDIASYLLSQTGLSMPTYQDKMSRDILNHLAGQAGVTMTYLSGAANWRVQEFEVQRNPYAGYISRLVRDGGDQMRIGNDGSIEVFSMLYDAPTSATFATANARQRVTKSAYYTRIILRKHTKQKAQYEFTNDAAGVYQGDLSPGLTMASINAVDLSISGKIGYIAFFDGPSASGNQVGYMGFDPQFQGVGPPSVGGGPAVSISYAIMPPNAPATTVNTKFVITGNAPGAFTYDPPFELAYPSYPNLDPHMVAEWQRNERRIVIESPLWNTRTFAASIAPAMFYDANKGTNVIEFPSILFDPHIWPGDSVHLVGIPYTRLETVRWQIEGAAPQMSAAGTKILWASPSGSAQTLPYQEWT